MSRTIFIGDIHGCSHEFSQLLLKVAPAVDDRMILIGDLVNKGPDPSGVLRTVQSLNCVCLRGNHESDHLKWRETGRAPKQESVWTKELMTADVYQQFLLLAAETALFIEDASFLAVHGAILPQVALLEQPEDILTGERTLPSSWKDKIDVEVPLIVGHKRYSENQKVPYVVEGKFYGLDTGCVYGGRLTALIWPSAELIQIPAIKDYAGRGLQ